MANEQLTHVHKNLVGFSAKLEEFYKSKEFTDVTVTCEDESSFKCHRLVLAAASQFFRAMFHKEKDTPKNATVLLGISGSTFKQVLEFMYTGDVIVTSVNVNDLLEASKFFQLHGIEERCVEFVKKYKLSVPNTLGMFVFACKTAKKTLIDLLSKDIAEQIKIFSRSDNFLELSFHDLNIIVEQWSLLSAKSDELLFGTIVRWIYHRREERSRFLDEFIKVVKFENMKSEYIKFIFKEVVAHQPDPASVVQSIKPTGCDIFPVLSRDALQNSEKKLHIYVRCDKNEALKVFSIKEMTECSSSDMVSVSVDSKQWIQSVALDDFNLYSLHYTRRSTTEDEDSKQSFHLYTTDMRVGLTLKSPPLIVQDVCLCPLESNIYLYNRTLSSRPAYLLSMSTFNHEELNRGIYVYNCNLDEWFPVPAMTMQLQDSCMTECNGTLYVIGGSDPNNSSDYSRFAQAYDYRDGKWRKLPKTVGNYVGGDCCSMNDRIYVCGGINNTRRSLEKYDPIAGKWYSLRAASKQMHYHQAISYSEKLWAMGSYVGDSSVNNFTMQVYSPLRDTWRSLDYKPVFNLNSGTILNSVVFNLL